MLRTHDISGQRVSDTTAGGVSGAVSDARCQTRGVSGAVSDARCQRRGVSGAVSDARCQRRGVRRAVSDARCQTRGVSGAVSAARCQRRGVSGAVSDARCQTPTVWVGGVAETPRSGVGDRGAHHKGVCLPTSVYGKTRPPS
jgi:hypothetical protein